MALESSQKGQFEAGIGFHADRSADAFVTAPASARLVVPVTEIGVAHGNGIADFAVGEDVIAAFLFVSHIGKPRFRRGVYPLYIFR